MSKTKDGKWTGSRLVAFRVNSEEIEEALAEIKELGFDQSDFIRNAIIESLRSLKQS